MATTNNNARLEKTRFHVSVLVRRTTRFISLAEQALSRSVHYELPLVVRVLDLVAEPSTYFGSSLIRRPRGLSVST